MIKEEKLVKKPMKTDNSTEKLVVKIEPEPTEEKLSSELEAVATEILEKQEEERIKKTTNPSAIALSSTQRDSGENIKKVKKTPKQLFILYLTNQFVARAVNVRADTLVSKGYKILGKDQKGIDMCKELIDNSGGSNLFWQLSVNTDIAGDGFLEKLYNLNKNKILRLKHVHPITLEFKKDKFDKIIVDSKTKEPVGYVQIHLDENGMEITTPVKKEIIEHLRYNTLGDEFTGMSSIQSGYDTIVQLMNMQYAAAEASIKTANPLLVGKCNTKSPHQIAQWGQILGRISGKDQVFLPQDMELEMLSPGNQNFSAYSDFFLNAVVATFGVPKSVLLGDSGTSGSGNRAEGVVLTRHFYSMIRGNQKYMEDFFNKIFEEYSELAGFKVPRLVFEDIAEDATLAAQSAMELFASGIITQEEARRMIGLEGGEGFKPQTQGEIGDLKKSQREVQFPKEAGKKTGSQKGIKKKQKISPFSEVKPDKK